MNKNIYFCVVYDKDCDIMFVQAHLPYEWDEDIEAQEILHMYRYAGEWGGYGCYVFTNETRLKEEDWKKIFHCVKLYAEATQITPLN